MKIQEETDVKEYQIRKKKSREQTVENMENKEKEVRETEPETTKEEDEHVKEMGMLSLDRRRNHQIELLTIIGEVEGHETVSGSTKATKYEHLLPKLAQIENSVQTDGVLILKYTGRRCGGGTCDCGNDRVFKQTDSISGTWRVSFYRWPSCCVGRLFFYCSKWDDDHSPGADKRNVHRCGTKPAEY